MNARKIGKLRRIVNQHFANNGSDVKLQDIIDNAWHQKELFEALKKEMEKQNG
jgi:hypothetical protein